MSRFTVCLFLLALLLGTEGRRLKIDKTVIDKAREKLEEKKGDGTGKLISDNVMAEGHDTTCTGESVTDPSEQAIVDNVIQMVQGKRKTKYAIRIIKNRLKDPNSKLRKMLGAAAADPRDSTEDVEEPLKAGLINMDLLNLLGRVVGTTRTVVGYLWQYGFIPKVLNQSQVASENFNGVIPPCAVTNAVKEFQKFNQLSPADGVLRKETRDLMAKDRCGNADVGCDTPECIAEDEAELSNNLKRKKRYVVKGRTWLDKTGDGNFVLKYFFDPEHMYDPTATGKKHHDKNMGEGIVKEQIEKGLESWTKYAPIQFIEVDNEFDADIKILFGKDKHSEKRSNAYFDGQYGILAHMYYPRSGKMHFDSAENFTASAIGPGINLQFVAAHEVGHGLGIKHSNVASALMGPYYWGYKEDMLERDDIEAIQSLYGNNGVGSVVPLSSRGSAVPAAPPAA